MIKYADEICELMVCMNGPFSQGPVGRTPRVGEAEKSFSPHFVHDPFFSGTHRLLRNRGPIFRNLAGYDHAITQRTHQHTTD